MAVETALVVDDSKSARVMLSRLLKKSGVNVAFAESAEEAFDYLNDAEPDLIFMDHMMPGMDGLHAVQLLAADARFAHIPVVMYTSKEDDGYLAKARSVGAVGVIGKPAKPALVERVLTDVNSRLCQQVKGNIVPKPVMPTSAPHEVASADAAAEPAPPAEMDIPKIEMVPSAKKAAPEPAKPARPITPQAPPKVAADAAASDSGGSSTAPIELATSLSKLTVSQVRSMIDTQVEGILRDELQSRVAEAVSHRLHEVVGGIKTGIKAEIEQDQLQTFKDRLDRQDARFKEFDETQEHINSIYEQISNYRDRLRDLDTKATDVEYYMSELHEKFVMQQEFKDQIEEIKDYIHKEVMRQFRPLEVALKQGLQVLDPENDEYQQFAVQLAKDLYPVFETRVQDKIREMVEAATPDAEADNAGAMRVISGSTIMAGLSLVMSLGLTAFVAWKLL